MMVLVSFALLIFACSKEKNQSEELGIATFKTSLILTKAESAALAVQQKETYRVSQNEMMERFVRFAKSTSKNASLQVQSITLKKNPATGKDLYYEVVFESKKGTGFSLMSADERVDDVLCYTEVGTISDTSFNKSLKFCIELVDLYVEEQTKEELVIEALIFSANEKMALRQIEKAPKTKDGGPPFDPNTWTFVKWTCDEIVDMRLKQIPGGWHQRSPYNDSLPEVIGCGTGNNKAYVGCVPTATIQIMSYHKKNFSSYITTASWPDMINNPTTSENLKKFIRDVFNYLIVDNKDGYYNTTATGISVISPLPYVRDFLDSNGYTTGAQTSYSYSNIWAALNYGPSCVQGIDNSRGGHVWVVDGAKSIYNDYYELWTYWDGNQLWEHRVYNQCLDLGKYVRYDWGSSAVDVYGNSINTWFPDGVFAFATSTGGNYNFNSDVQLISYIY